VLNRIEFEAKQEQCDHTLTVDALRIILLQHEHGKQAMISHTWSSVLKIA
jgi:hypothetical protein